MLDKWFNVGCHSDTSGARRDGNMLLLAIIVDFEACTSSLVKGEEVWFIDVLEWRAKMGANVYLKTGKEVGFKTLGESVKKRRARKLWKLWKKAFFNTKICEVVTWVGENGQELEMEIVARIERTCAPLEVHASLKGFDKEWSVPTVVIG